MYYGRIFIFFKCEYLRGPSERDKTLIIVLYKLFAVISYIVICNGYPTRYDMIRPRYRRLNRLLHKRMVPQIFEDSPVNPMMTQAEDSKGGPGKGPQCNDKLANVSKQRASNIAQKAAQEAKAASEAQAVAGQQAAHQVKAQLAEKALQAAKAAEAALAGKQAIVEQLEQEVREAEAVVQEETSSLQQAQQNVNAAMQAAQQAALQLRTLTGAVQTAQANVGNSEAAAQGAQQELSEKTQLMEAAKNRVEQLLRQLSTARADFANTKQAAYKASAAAHEAKANAARNKRMLLVRQGFRPRYANSPGMMDERNRFTN